MKKLKRIIGLLLAGSMLFLAACGNSSNGGSDGNGNGNAQTGGGRYVETDITPPIEGRFQSFLADDGTIVCYDEGLKNRYESTDGGETWTQADGPGATDGRFVQVSQGDLMSDASLLVFLEGEGLVKVAPDGNIEAFPVKELDDLIAAGEQVMMQALDVLSDSRVYLSFMAGGFTTRRVSGVEDAGDEQTSEGGAGEGGTNEDDGSELEPPPEIEGAEGPTMSGGPTTEQGGGNSSGPQSAGQVREYAGLHDLSNGEQVADLTGLGGGGAASNGEVLYLAGTDGKVTPYNLSDGSKISGQERALPSTGSTEGMGMMLMEGGGSLTADKDGNLYTLNEGDFIKLGTDNQVETLLESTSCAFGSPRSSVDSTLILPDSSIVLVVSEDSTSKLYKYTWDPNATYDPDKSISVWSLEDNDVVRAAISELRKKYPDAEITYEVALGESSGMTAEDAVKNLNTRLLSDDGPDVIILDGVPMENYAAQGMLADLSELLDTGDVYEQIMEPFGQDGGLYYLPTQFWIPVLLGDTGTLDAADTLDKLIDAVVNGNEMPKDTGPSANGDPMNGVSEEERSVLGLDDLRDLYDLLWNASGASIVDNNTFDSDSLSEFLAALEAICTKYGLAEESSGEGPSMGMAVGDGGTSLTVDSAVINYLSKKAQYGAFNAGSILMLQMVTSNVFTDKSTEYAAFPGLTEGAWQPTSIAGVSADSDNIELAAEMIQAMLSAKIQGVGFGAGFPVTRTGAEKQIADLDKRERDNGNGGFDFDFEQITSLLGQPMLTDDVVIETVWITAQRYCKGEIALEGAVKQIEQDLKNYLAERA